MSNNSSSGPMNHLQKLFDQSTKVLFVYLVEPNQISYINPAFEKIWNLSIDKAMSDPASLLETVHPEDKGFIINFYKEVLQGKKKEKIEFRLLLDDGNIRWLLLTTPLLIKEASTQHIITGMLEDITGVKEHYNVLEKFAAKKNSILEILSHDLAGPLNNIRGMSSLLAEEIKEYENTELEKLIAMIIKTSERSIQLIRNFVQQEFLTSANSISDKKRVNIVKKIKESIEEYKNSEKHIAKKLKFIFSHEEIFIDIDDYKFMQVINNLISNSIKFTPDGGIITVSIEEKQNSVFFTVADNGIGIPVKYHNELFDRFTHARRPGLKGEPSTGLGMSIIKTIVEWHNGRIWFDSKENEGTSFFIDLPKK